MSVLKYRASDGTIKTLAVSAFSGIAGVSSVNGKTGEVTDVYTNDNPPPYPVTSVNGKTGRVSGLYSDENAPPYPVTSVFNMTGAVNPTYSSLNIQELDENQGINFPPLCTLTAGASVTTLPAGNNVTRYLIFNDVGASIDSSQFLLRPLAAKGMVCNIVAQHIDSLNRPVLELYFETVGSSAASFGQGFAITNLSTKTYSVYDFLRSIP